MQPGNLPNQILILTVSPLRREYSPSMSITQASNKEWTSLTCDSSLYKYSLGAIHKLRHTLRGGVDEVTLCDKGGRDPKFCDITFKK